ncbi:uracil phosphoribosyltransferase homolog [Ptychodera flava]|uniref:uracil phosphoribosyltransferase homolog n=1 Tax=Ptychodera flava TaxID=63121 RepID=UPI00396A45FE
MAGEKKSGTTDARKPNVNQMTFGPKVKILKQNDQIKELQTVIRDQTTSRGDFVFYADRLIRLVVEEGLNQLPYQQCTVTTPTGCSYNGIQFQKGNCGVSIMRSGEAMEQGLRDCCRSIRIGKILIKSDEDTNQARVFYAKLPQDIDTRKVLLMYPILSSGNTVIQAVNVLKEHGVADRNIILLNIFATPHAIRTVIDEHPEITVLTSEIHPTTPNHFGQKYFGTD